MAVRRHRSTRAHRPGQRIGPPILVRPPDWTSQARCAPEQADRLFFADPSDPDEPDPGTATDRQAEALAICAGCPVRADCRLEAAAVDAQHGHHGVWAGLTSTARKPVKPKPVRARVRRRRADPRTPIPELSEVAFDADVLRLADQGLYARDIAKRLNRSLRDVELARTRAQLRRRRAARRAQNSAARGQVAA